MTKMYYDPKSGDFEHESYREQSGLATFKISGDDRVRYPSRHHRELTLPEVSSDVYDHMDKDTQREYDAHRHYLIQKFKEYCVAVQLLKDQGPEAVDCPYCEAMAGGSCVTKSGNIKKECHKDREEQADKAERRHRHILHSMLDGRGCQDLLPLCKEAASSYRDDKVEGIIEELNDVKISVTLRRFQDGRFRVVEVDGGNPLLVGEDLREKDVSSLYEKARCHITTKTFYQV